MAEKKKNGTGPGLWDYTHGVVNGAIMILYTIGHSIVTVIIFAVVDGIAYLYFHYHVGSDLEFVLFFISSFIVIGAATFWIFKQILRIIKEEIKRSANILD